MTFDDARAVPPEPSAYRALLQALNTRLREEAPTWFAGTGPSGDGGINVFVTEGGASVHAVVHALQASIGGTVKVHVISGRKWSLATLESLRDRLLAQRQALAVRGINLAEFGVDERSNKVRVGVKRLDPTTIVYLNAQFGEDRIAIFESGEWEPTSA